ncbi:MAG: radical SAM protein [Planctomycetota bacterium]
MADRPYIFAELTNSICATCLRKVEAKVILQEGRVYLDKFCPEHRHQRVLVASDADYWQRSRRTLKPGQLPLHFNTRETALGCPYDCGLCPGHEQHSCLTVLEITEHCNLSCPVCYADSGPTRTRHRTLAQIEAMLDAVVRNEGEPDVVQISGGEPTLHPQFFEVLDAARARPIKHLMLNTNGLRIARDPAFAERLATCTPGFEVYLQFDSLREGPLRTLRGADLRDVRRRALDRLNALGISTTLVVVLQHGLNDDELGEIVQFALQQPCVRGVTFQPVQVAGRLDTFDPARDRLTLSEVRTRLIEQCGGLFAPDDVVPVPCNPDCIAMAYALKLPGAGVVPLTRFVDPQALLDAGNTITFEHGPLREKVVQLFSTAHSPESCAGSLQSLLCCLPQIEVPAGFGYENLFRVIIMQFLDPWNFDVRAVKRSCVHIVHPDGRLIPFDTYNLFYREGLEPVLARASGRAALQPVAGGAQ